MPCLIYIQNFLKDRYLILKFLLQIIPESAISDQNTPSSLKGNMQSSIMQENAFAISSTITQENYTYSSAEWY